MKTQNKVVKNVILKLLSPTYIGIIYYFLCCGIQGKLSYTRISKTEEDPVDLLKVGSLQC